MLAKVKSFGLTGLIGYEVDVEVDVNAGLPGIEMVGLPDAAIRESRERVRSAIKNSAYKFAPNKITINLAPADIKKEGPLYDLPIALAVLAATQQLNAARLQDGICRGIIARRLFAKSTRNFAYNSRGKEGGIQAHSYSLRKPQRNRFRRRGGSVRL